MEKGVLEQSPGSRTNLVHGFAWSQTVLSVLLTLAYLETQQPTIQAFRILMCMWSFAHNWDSWDFWRDIG